MLCCAEKLELDDMQAERVKKYDGTSAYARDKRRMQVYGEEFAKRWHVRMQQSSPMSWRNAAFDK